MTQGDATRKRQRRLAVALARTIVASLAASVAASLALVIAVALPSGRDALARSAIAAYLASKGCRLEQADLTIGGGVLGVRGLVVSEGGRPFFDADDVRITYGARDRAFGVSSVRVVKPQLFVHRASDGSYDVSRFAGSGPSSSSSGGAPVRMRLDIAGGSVTVVSDAAPASTARLIALREVDVRADVDQGGHSSARASLTFAGAPSGSGLKATFDENDAARIARAKVVVRGAQLAPLVDVPVSSSAFVVEHGIADMRIDGYAIGWDAAAGPQWRFVGAGTIGDGALRTLPLTRPVERIAGRVAMFDGTLEFEGVRGDAGGVPLEAGGSLELFPDVRLGLRVDGRGPLDRVRSLLAFSSKLPLAGDVAMGITLAGVPSSPHVDIEARGTGATRYGAASVEGLAASAYYHDGHVAVRSFAAHVGSLSLHGDGDIDMTAAPVAGDFVVVGHGRSREIPVLADVEPKGTTSALLTFSGPLMKLSGSGFASTSGGEQQVRALASAGAGGVEFASILRDRKGGELVALGELGRGADSPTAIDLYAQRYHARSNGALVDIPGITRRSIGWPRAAATITGYAFVRGAQSMPSAAVSLSGDDVRIGGRQVGHVVIGASGRGGLIGIDRVAVNGPAIHVESAGAARIFPGGGGRIGIAAALGGSVGGDIGKITGSKAARGRIDASFGGVARGSSWLAEIDATSPDRTVRVGGLPVRDLRAVVGSDRGDVVVYGASADVADGHIDAQGTLPGTRAGSLSIAVRGLDLASQHVVALPIANGAVVAIGRVGGTAASPDVSGSGALVDGSYAGVPLAADADVSYRGGSLAVIGARVVGANSFAAVDGRIDAVTSSSPRVALDASVPEADLATLSAAFGPASAPLGGIASAHVRAAGPLRDPAISGEFSSGAGTIGGVGFTDLDASIDAGRGYVDVRHGGMTFGSSRIALSGRAGDGGAAIRVASAHVDLDDFNDFFDGKDVLEGSGRLDVAISDIPGDDRASGSLALDSASIESVPLGTVSGRVSRVGGDLEIAAEERGPIAASVVDFRIPPQSGGRPSASVRGEVSRLDLAALAPYVGLEDARLHGIAHGSFAGSTSARGVRGSLTFGLRGASVHGVALRDASGGATYADGSIALHRLRVAIDGASAVVDGSVDASRRIRAHADVAVDDLHALSAFSAHPMPIGGSAVASIDADGPIALPALRARVSASDGQIRHVRFDSVTAAAAFDRGMLTTNGSIQLADDRGTLAFSGSVPVQTKPFRVGPNDKPIAFDARLDGLGVGALDPLIGHGVSAAGRAAGSVRVRGSAGRPNVSGALHLDGVTVSSTYDRVPLSSIVAEIDLANDSIELKRLHGVAGSGTLDARGGAHIVPATAIRKYASLQYAFGMQLHGADIDVPDVMKGTVDAQLGFTKPGAVPYFYGGAQFTHTTIPFATILALASKHETSSGDTEGIPGLPPIEPHHIVVYGGPVFGDDLDHVERPTPPPTPPPAIAVVPSSVGLDLKVVAGQDVSVNGLLDVTGHGEVDVGGTTSSPTLDGVLTAVRGRAGFLNTDFQLLDGAVVFKKKDGLIPDVTADAVTHTEDADVTVSTYGRIDQLHTDLESDPPMDENAIVATLLHVPQINSALASSHGEQQSAFGVSPGDLVSGAIAGQILGALNIGLEQVFNLEEVDFGLDPLGRPELEVRKQVSPRAYTLYRTTFSVPPAQALGIAYQVRRAIQVELTQSQMTPGALGTYALPQTSLMVKLTFH